MKTFKVFFLGALVAVSFISSSAYALERLEIDFKDSNVETIYNPPRADEVFVPPGFDDMDDTEITFINHSTNSCFLKTFALQPVVDTENKVIRISNLSMVLKSDFCKYRDISTPSTVRIGELNEGVYKIEFETAKNEYKQLATIEVHKSESVEKDDFEYAPIDVNSLLIDVDHARKNINVKLAGSFPNGCYSFKEVKIFDNRAENVIEVLPIVEMKTGVCTQDIRFFAKKIKVGYNETKGTKKLIHIRAADGVAINRVVELK